MRSTEGSNNLVSNNSRVSISLLRNLRDYKFKLILSANSTDQKDFVRGVPHLITVIKDPPPGPTHPELRRHKLM